MMRFFHALCSAVLGCAATAAAQPTWIQTSSMPTASHLNDVDFVTPERGFIVGNNLVRLRTEDGGATWIKEQEVGAGGPAWSGMVFHDGGQAGFLMGATPERTTDGGITWEPVPNLPVGGWSQVDWAGSESEVYFGTNGAIAFSPDMGSTWEVRSGYPHCPLVESMDFVTEDLGLVSGRRLEPYDEGMYRTADGGRTWVRVYESVARSVRWLSPTTAEADTYDGTIRSEDGGLTWAFTGEFIAFPLGTAAHVDLGEGLMVAVTSLGEIHRSHDSGFLWYQVSEALAEMGDETWAITLTPDRRLWVVGKYGFILRSDDEGFTWTQVSSGMGLYMDDMEMFSNTLGMAVGGHGYLWRTTDSGRRWTVTKLIEHPAGGAYEGLAAIDIVDDEFAVAGGPGGIMFRTWDGGATWEDISQPSTLSIRDLCFTDRDHGWMLADVLYRTTTGGLIWDPVPGNIYGKEVHFADPMRGWVMDGSNTVQRTTDGGQTWVLSGVPGDPLVLESMAWLDADNGWVVGRFGYCAKTTNGGLSWQLLNIGGQGVSMFDVAPVSATEVWGVGFDSQYNNFIMRSLNGGASWTRWNRSTYDSQTLNHIRVRPDGGLHIGGFFGLMLTDGFPRRCTGDWDASEEVNSNDISAFLSAWLGSVQSGNLAADVDEDGLVNSNDISTFLTAWLGAVQGGC